jgi:hypothetical protein
LSVNLHSKFISSATVEDVYLDPARVAAKKMERIQREKAEAVVSYNEDSFLTTSIPQS